MAPSPASNPHVMSSTFVQLSLFKDANTQTRLARIGSWSVHSLAHLRKKEVCEGVEARTVYSVPAQWPCKWKQIALTWFRGMPGALDICSHQPCCVLQLYSQQLRKPKKKKSSAEFTTFGVVLKLLIRQQQWLECDDHVPSLIASGLVTEAFPQFCFFALSC